MSGNVFEALEVRRLFSAPVLTTVTVTPDTQARLSKVTVVVAASTDTKSVQYVLDTNSSGTVDPSDFKIGTSSKTASGFAFTKQIPKTALLGPATILAVGKNKDGASTPVSTTLTITNVAPTAKKLVAAPAKVKQTKTFNINANGVKDVDGKIASAVFFLDVNGNGAVDGGDTLLGNWDGKGTPKVTKVGASSLAVGPNSLVAVLTDNDGATTAPIVGSVNVTPAFT
jgi:hypothetical protein